MLEPSIECLGTQATFSQGLKLLRLCRTLSSLGTYDKDWTLAVQDFSCGLGDHSIVFSLCLGTNERMRRLMEIIANNYVDLTKIVTHTLPFSKIIEEHDIFDNQKDSVL